MSLIACFTARSVTTSALNRPVAAEYALTGNIGANCLRLR